MQYQLNTYHLNGLAHFQKSYICILSSTKETTQCIVINHLYISNLTLYLFNLYIYSTVQKIIIDPINNEISTTVVINNVTDDVSPLLLVKGEVIVGKIAMEPFEVDIVVRVIILFTEEGSLEILSDSIVANVLLISSDFVVMVVIVTAGEIIVVEGSFEIFFDSIIANVVVRKDSVTVLLISSDFIVIVVVTAGETAVVVGETANK